MGEEKSEGLLVGQAGGGAGGEGPGLGESVPGEEDGCCRVQHQGGAGREEILGQIEDRLGIEEDLVGAADAKGDARQRRRTAGPWTQDEPIVGGLPKGCPEGM